MFARSLIAVAAAGLALGPIARAADWGSEWQDDVQPAGGYDVSVDLNVQGGVTFETFQGSLQPYGDWVVVGSYGRVWRPHVPAGWRPYYYGRWEWTNEGWLWVSDEPWGWAAYHYGRWAYDPYYGWLWVPGYEWSPAWVSWRVSGDAIGWAPLAPGYSVYVTSYPFIDFWWTFVPSARFVSVPVYSAAYAPAYTRRWYEATAPAPAYVSRGAPRTAVTPAWGGPAPRSIEQRIGRPLAPSRIVGVPAAPAPGTAQRPGEIPVYRPERQARADRYPPVPAPAPLPAPAPAPMPAPVRGAPVRAAPPWAGPGRGSGPAPAPGWSPARGVPQQAGRGPAPAPAPAPPAPGWAGERGGGHGGQGGGQVRQGGGRGNAQGGGHAGGQGQREHR
jgi:hypothetical protein